MRKRRMAAPLTAYLEPAKGSYEGFDITAAGVWWCENAYRDYPNFRFQRAAIRSELYGVAEGVPAEEYRFPYEDGEFDIVILTSVFTHLLPRVVEHYLDEIHRVLKSRGTCFATYYLMDARAQEASQDTPAALKFQRLSRDETAWTTDLDHPEAVVAYDIDYVMKSYADRSLALVEVCRGRWPVVYPVLMPMARSYQDIVVAHKS